MALPVVVFSGAGRAIGRLWDRFADRGFQRPHRPRGARSQHIHPAALPVQERIGNHHGGVGVSTQPRPGHRRLITGRTLHLRLQHPVRDQRLTTPARHTDLVDGQRVDRHHLGLGHADHHQHRIRRRVAKPGSLPRGARTHPAVSVSQGPATVPAMPKTAPPPTARRRRPPPPATTSTSAHRR
ncbi:hypothetical protein I552_0660 [Mycobacterium xenopi 3993]|nr:hypothetical protein I552_0660 [Mycobacterium xenopi 3993]